MLDQPPENAPWLQSIARRLAPGPMPSNDEVLVAFVGISSAVGLVGALAAAVAMAHVGQHFGAGLMAMLALVLAVGLAALRMGESPRRVATSMVVCLFIAWAATLLSSGGEHVGVLYAGSLVPLFSVLVVGAKVGGIATAVVVGLVATTFALRVSGFAFPIEVDPAAVADVKFVAAVILPILTFVSLVLHFEIRRVLLEAAEEEARARADADLRTRALGDEFDRLRTLAGSVAHDFNNFLTAIRGSAEIAAFHPRADATLLAAVGVIEKSADRAAGVVSELMAFARRGSTNRTVLDLRDTVSEVLALARNAFDRPLRLQLDHPAQPLWISADADTLSSVVLNLLKNAIEATGEASGAIEVRTHVEHLTAEDLANRSAGAATEPGDYACVSIIDPGPGIPAERAAQVFEPFVSGKSAGRGLGLAVARRFADAHAAAIHLSSVPGRTCFRVALPLGAVPDLTEDFKSPAALGLEGRRILVVDDDPTVRLVVCAMLDNQQAIVLEADGGRSAIDLLESADAPVDVALIDVAMPGLGGEETFHELRERQPGLPAVIMSGHAEAEFVHLGELPEVRTLRKPFSLSVLAGKINELLA